MNSFGTWHINLLNEWTVLYCSHSLTLLLKWPQRTAFHDSTLTQLSHLVEVWAPNSWPITYRICPSYSYETFPGSYFHSFESYRVFVLVFVQHKHTAPNSTRWNEEDRSVCLSSFSTIFSVLILRFFRVSGCHDYQISQSLSPSRFLTLCPLPSSNISFAFSIRWQKNNDNCNKHYL